MVSNIYLIGPRACGKTTVGKQLADKLRLEFFDSDEVLVRKAGCEIAQYVEQHGWDGFRDLEAEVLRELSVQQNAVISCGGGIVVREENRTLLGDNFTVYIKADVETLANRLLSDPNHDQRPSLTGKSIVDEIREVLDAREDLYSGCANLVADGSGSIEDVCSEILDSYQSFSKGEK
ncbi:shikimate kinase AroL [Maridesulfovibrio salexigens]|uniref:Shikimate kinase n=1 Tax=Maridesulfovibrio salexigens (strain ATCC 14822 / DSM 2638 / NCIMB 8403 / VKM B-1763) TaxID=526222 RepID=C6C0I5_MARSD|nr:shikimate kinase AroL [Maridesulfovibrio salexigens]ACS79119.1 Shikimate kinase [Maridesulfovibrio salexigens DSM 2638]